MKRFTAFILALMLCVSLMSVTAMATETASLGISSAQTEAGNTVTLNISINAPAIGGIVLCYDYDDTMLELVEFKAVANGWLAGITATWESGVTSNSALYGTILTLTFKVKDDAKIGDSAKVSVYADSAYTWNEDGMSYEALPVSGSTGTITVVCDHAWNEGKVTKPHTCTEDGEMLYTCTKCGATKTEVIPAAHTWSDVWSYNANEHFHECTKCDATADNDRHHMNVVDSQAPEGDKNGYYLWDCDECDYQWRETWYPNEPPRVGDIRPMMALGFCAVLFTLTAAAYVFKRKVNV